jgi:hypothetical protein
VAFSSNRRWFFYRDGNPAIAHFKALRRKGGGFLLFPSTAFSWLDYYSDFRCHLDSRYARMADNEDCIIYDLQSSEKKIADSLQAHLMNGRALEGRALLRPKSRPDKGRHRGRPSSNLSFASAHETPRRFLTACIGAMTLG